MKIFRPIGAACATTLVLLTGPAAAQRVLGSHAVQVQYGGLGTPQTTVRDPWFATVVAPPWEGSVDLSAGPLKAGAIATTEGVANTYSSTQFAIFNADSANALALPSMSMHFDALLAITGDTDAGRAFATVHGIATMTLSGTSPVARLDHQVIQQCDALQLDCRGSVSTQPVLQGGGTVSVIAATPGYVEANLVLPAFVLAPLGWQLPAGVTLASDRALSWVTPVPEPGSGALMLLGVATPAGAARRRRRSCTLGT